MHFLFVGDGKREPLHEKGAPEAIVSAQRTWRETQATWHITTGTHNAPGDDTRSRLIPRRCYSDGAGALWHLAGQEGAHSKSTQKLENQVGVGPGS